MAAELTSGDRVLFQGDSITDAGRQRDNPSNLGTGYAAMAASWFFAAHPGEKVTFMNRGNSGNRVADLVGRWKEDCLELKPTWVSIMIGVNDCWRRYDSNDATSVENFEAGYRKILKQTREILAAKIILVEPYVLPVPADRKRWREDLDPKIHVVRELAREFKTLLVPMDGIFASAAAQTTPDFWAADGVHPTSAGAALIARAWLQAVRAV